MRLELGLFPVRDVAFKPRTRWHGGILEVNRDELVGLVIADPRVVDVEVELARPGESVRITKVRDVIEPRVKVEGPGVAYPGVCGRPVVTVGRGRTHCLTGMAVVEVADVLPHEGVASTITGGGDWPFIEMCGPGAKATPYGSLVNLCLVMKTDTSLKLDEQNNALHAATLRVSDRLASATKSLEAPEEKVFELGPVDPSLPRVVYICCLTSPEHYSGSLIAFGTSIYGQTRLTLPWALHPNEVLDGAISAVASWIHVNNPIVLELCRHHGVDLCFAGCIALRTRWSSQTEKDITALQAANIAYLLGATGAIVTLDAGGNDFVEAIRTVQACERVGVKTVFVTGEEPTSAGGPTLLDPVSEADAIVSVGSVGQAAPSHMPVAIERVIGPPTIDLSIDPHGPRHIVSAFGSLPSSHWIDHYGFGRGSCFAY